MDILVPSVRDHHLSSRLLLRSLAEAPTAGRAARIRRCHLLLPGFYFLRLTA
jgi:hypothetical protein